MLRTLGEGVGSLAGTSTSFIGLSSLAGGGVGAFAGASVLAAAAGVATGAGEGAFGGSVAAAGAGAASVLPADALGACFLKQTLQYPLLAAVPKKPQPPLQRFESAASAILIDLIFLCF